MSKYGVLSGPYFSVFGANTEKYGPEKTPYLDTFHTVCIFYIQIEVNDAGDRLPAILLLLLYSEIVAKNDKYIRFYFNILNIVCLRLLKSIKVVSTKPFWK